VHSLVEEIAEERRSVMRIGLLIREEMAQHRVGGERGDQAVDYGLPVGGRGQRDVSCGDASCGDASRGDARRGDARRSAVGRVDLGCCHRAGL
jgi:hypothetical protein